MAKAAFEGIKSGLETANSAADLAGSINQFLHAKSTPPPPPPKKKSRLSSFFETTIGRDEDDVDTSLATAASHIADAKEMAEMERKVQIMLMKRFGANVWNEILDERQRLIQKKSKLKKERAENRRREAEESKKRWRKIGQESLKFGCLLVASFAIGWLLLTAYQTGPIR